MRYNAVRAFLALAGLIGLAACGTGSASASPPSNGHSASIAVSLKVVPTIRSVTVSPTKDTFGNCKGGDSSLNTAATSAALGYPNARCWLGKPGSAFPITITNSGIASYIYVSGSNAVPSDGGTQWSLCNPGANAAVACTSDSGLFPGKDQYVVRNFSPDRGLNSAGLTDTPACDTGFGSANTCWTTNGQSQQEGLQLTGPSVMDDSSTAWTVTITWLPVPTR
jgi:hypothetical protein